MDAGRISIAVALRFMMLVALNLALLRGVAWVLGIPIVLFLVVATNVVLVQAAVLGRPLRAPHYTFLAIGTAYGISATLLLANIGRDVLSSSRQLGGAVARWYWEVTGDDRIFRVDFLWVFWSAGYFVVIALGLLLSCGGGMLVARRLRRRERRTGGRAANATASFLQGAVIGLGVVAIGTSALAYFGRVPPVPDTPLWYAHLVGVAAFPILGGLAGSLAARSRRSRPSIQDPTP